MGQPKATLEWHGSTLVRRAVGIVARVADGPLVVVRAHDQALPELPAEVELTQDARARRGPLEGLAAGLEAVGTRAEAAFVCGVDTPLLHPALAARLLAALAQDAACEIALPVAHGFPHPLCAAYRTSVTTHLRELLAEDRLATRTLIERCATAQLDEAAVLADPAVARHDPQLDSLLNLNTPAEYEAARARPAPAVHVAGRGTVRAATLADAGEGGATVNGRATTDPHEPLAAGDTVAFAARQRYRPPS